MAKRMTTGTKQLALNIEAGLRDRIAERMKAERRTLRAVVEMALLHYLATVPLEGEQVAKAKVAKP